MPAKVLILEDDPELQSLLLTVLESEGYDVTAASRGQEAIEFASKNAYDLVVTDIRMEGMDGLEALEHMRGQRPDVKSLVITGYSSEEDSVRAVRMGVGGFLKKPFSLDEFLDSVRGLLAKRQEERKRQTAEGRLTDSLHWALRSLARCLEQSPGAQEISGITNLSRRLCAAVELGPEATESVELSALYLAVTEVAGSLLPGDTPPFSAQVERVVRSAEEWFDGSGGPEGLEGEAIPLESRLTSLVLTLTLDAPEKESAADWLEERYPGRFDPALLKLLAELGPETESENRQNAADRRGLLSLARAFEEAGNTASARQAFETLSETGASRVSVSALQGLARLALAAGEAQESCEYANRATKRAEQVGPTVAASVALESGLLVMEAGNRDQGLAMLAAADRLYQSLDIAAGQAAVKIAGLEPGSLDGAGEALEVLLRPENAERMSGWSSWVLPRVLEMEPGPGLQKNLHRLVREHPRAVFRWLAPGRGGPRARGTIIEALKDHNVSGREPILKLLEKDSDPQVRQAAAAARASAEGVTNLPLLRIYSLGPLEVYTGDERVQEAQWKSQKGKYLLAFLAAQRGRPVSDDIIIDMFWTKDPKKARRSLYWSTSMLRKCLNVEGTETEAILRTPAGLQLNPQVPRWHDLEEFEDLASAVSKAGSKEYNMERYLRVVELYRGPYLEGSYLDWVVDERNRLERMATDLLGRFVEWALSTNRHREALDYARRLLEIDRLRQDAHLAIMKATTSLGRPEEAVRQFKTCEKLLRQEMDLEPSIAMLEAHQRALLSIP